VWYIVVVEVEVQVVVRVIVAKVEGRAAIRRMGIGLRISMRLCAVCAGGQDGGGEMIQLSAYAGSCGFAQAGEFALMQWYASWYEICAIGGRLPL